MCEYDYSVKMDQFRHNEDEPLTFTATVLVLCESSKGKCLIAIVFQVIVSIYVYSENNSLFCRVSSWFLRIDECHALLHISERCGRKLHWVRG